MPDLSWEQLAHEQDKASGLTKSIVAGLDEAGRGPFAGPLIAAAVILPEMVNLPGITDSKQIEKRFHQSYAKRIIEQAVAVGIGVADVEYINQYGVGAANRYALELAVKDLAVTPTHLLIDGGPQQKIQSEIPQIQITKGDTKSLSIAAASIVAKSIHDELMRGYAKEFPQYNWEKNAGYGTPDHFEALRKYGICKYHRTSFRPIQKIMQERGQKQ